MRLRIPDTVKLRRLPVPVRNPRPGTENCKDMTPWHASLTEPGQSPEKTHGIKNQTNGNRSFIRQENWLSKASTTKTCRHVVPRSHPSHHHHRHPWHKLRELRNLVWCSSFIFRGAKPLWSQMLARLFTESYKSWCLLHVFQQDARLNRRPINECMERLWSKPSADSHWLPCIISALANQQMQQIIAACDLVRGHGLIMFQPRNHRHKHCTQVLIQSALSFLHGRGNGNLPNSFRPCWPACFCITKGLPQESARSMTQWIGLTKGLW